MFRFIFEMATSDSGLLMLHSSGQSEVSTSDKEKRKNTKNSDFLDRF